MEYLTLNNGIKMPIMGFGTWDLQGKECEQSVLEALGLGYRLIDTAQMYGNEREVGNALKKSGIPREELFITTKIYRPNNSYEGAKVAIDNSLKELQVDYIDLLLIHEPYHESQEMYRAMKKAYQCDRLRAIGISNFNEKLYENFIKTCGIIPAVNQVETHVFYQQKSLQEKMAAHGTCMEAWSPFAAGKKDIFNNEVLISIGKAYEKSAAQIALKYLIQKGIAVIPKSANRNRMIENINIFDFQLTNNDMKQLENLDQKNTLFGWY